MSTRIEQLRTIVDTRTMGKVDGQTVDLFSASALVTMYDALAPRNQARFDEFPLSRLLDLAFKHAR